MEGEASAVIGTPPPTLEDAAAMIQVLRGELERSMVQINNLTNEVSVARATAGHAASSSSPLPAGCRAVPPANYSGQKDAESLESWLFSVEQYFDITGLKDELRRVQFAGTLLRGPALVWFRYMCSTRELGAFIQSWPMFSQELRLNFCPTNTVKLARDKLAYLRQNSASVRDYIREFRTVTMEIPGISADEKLDRFVRGLKPYIRKEVELREPPTYEDAIKLAEKFDSVQRTSSSSTQSSYVQRNSSGHYHSRRSDYHGPAPMDLNAVQTRQPHAGQRSLSPAGRQPKTFTRLTPELRAKLMAEGKCLYCREPGHFMDECPKRKGQGNGRRPPTPGQRR